MLRAHQFGVNLRSAHHALPVSEALHVIRRSTKRKYVPLLVRATARSRPDLDFSFQVVPGY